MKKTIVFHTILLIGLVFLPACTANMAVETNSETVISTAAEIADFDLPAEYQADFSASFDDYVASFRPDNDHSHLYLIQSSKEADGEQLAAAFEKLVPGSSDPRTRMRIIETRPIVIQGQPTELIISEGINSDGESYRQAMAAFQGKGGPALLVYSASVSTWEQEAVDAFLASIQ